MTPLESKNEDELFDRITNELANYWYQEQKYTVNGRWQDCKEEAKRQIQELIAKARIEAIKTIYDNSMYAEDRTAKDVQDRLELALQTKKDK
jgi:serine phosphatase RsbU (regulator of sigma subunit)